MWLSLEIGLGIFGEVIAYMKTKKLSDIFSFLYMDSSLYVNNRKHDNFLI